MSISWLNSWSGLSHKDEVITRPYGTGALRFQSCARLSVEIGVTAAKCAGGIHSSRAWGVRSNSHAATPQWVMLTGVLMCCGAHLIWVAHNAPNLSNTESQDIPPHPPLETEWPPALIHLLSFTSAFFYYHPPPLFPPPPPPPPLRRPLVPTRERRRSVARIFPSRPKWRRRSLG